MSKDKTEVNYRKAVPAERCQICISKTNSRGFNWCSKHDFGISTMAICDNFELAGYGIGNEHNDEG